MFQTFFFRPTAKPNYLLSTDSDDLFRSCPYYTSSNIVHMANSVYQSLDVVAPIATPGEISKTTPVEGKDTEAGGLGIVDGEGNDKIQAAELSEAPSAEPEKVHEYYNDPAADIEVVAKDGTIFRAYKHILRRKR